MALIRVLTLLAVVAAVLLPSFGVATEFTVGDEKGWTLGVNYTEWVKDKVFQVGDQLVFNYDSDHNVMKVSGATFKSCNTASGVLETLSKGHDVVTLTSPGRKWYICGVAGHCDGGMKFVINVDSNVEAPTVSPPASPAPSSDAIAAKAFHEKLIAVIGAVAVMVLIIV